MSIEKKGVIHRLGAIGMVERMEVKGRVALHAQKKTGHPG